jgi:D-glycero-D-manno-heptose 1,7-bisphosphate phosphatase
VIPAVRLVMLDRDGTINRKAPDGEYVKDPSELDLLPGAAQAIARLNEAGVPVAVVTNQRGIALGRMTMDDLEAVHAELVERLADADARVDAMFVCPHERNECDCRKPAPGLLQAALRRFGAAPREAVMVGDSASDVEAGLRAGTWTVQLVPAGVPTDADAVADDLRHAVDLVLGG